MRFRRPHLLSLWKIDWVHFSMLRRSLYLSTRGQWTTVKHTVSCNWNYLPYFYYVHNSTKGQSRHNTIFILRSAKFSFPDIPVVIMVGLVRVSQAEVRHPGASSTIQSVLLLATTRKSNQIIWLLQYVLDPVRSYVVASNQIRTTPMLLLASS